MRLFANFAVFATALSYSTTQVLADELSFGYDNPHDCLVAHGACLTVEREQTLAEFMSEHISFKTLADIAEANNVPVEVLQNGNIILRPGVFFAS